MPSALAVLRLERGSPAAIVVLRQLQVIVLAVHPDGLSPGQTMLGEVSERIAEAHLSDAMLTATAERKSRFVSLRFRTVRSFRAHARSQEARCRRHSTLAIGVAVVLLRGNYGQRVATPVTPARTR
jgi:hypothetical protein